MKGIMKQSAAALLILTGLSMGQNVLAASPISIDITGTVVASACAANVVGGSGNVIDLGQIQATALLAPNSSTADHPFQIALTACPVTTTAFVATFSGTAFTGNQTLFKNAGTAGDTVQVKVVNTDNASANNSVLDNGGKISGTISAGSATLNLKASAVSTQGQAKPGTIQSNIQVAFEYS